MSCVDSYSCYRAGLELALMQKAEINIREIIQKPSDEFLIAEPVYLESYLTFEYLEKLMKLIDVDPYLSDEFAQFYHKVMAETNEYDEEGFHVYTYSLGLLADGIRKYGEEAFEDLLEEVNELMTSLPGVRILKMAEYISFIFEFTDIKKQYYWEFKNFMPEMKCTFLYHWDLGYYCTDDAIDIIKVMPSFTKKYLALYEKIIKAIQSLGGIGSYDLSGGSEKRAV